VGSSLECGRSWVRASSVVDRGFEPWSGQSKDSIIGICCFSTKHAALRRKSKDCLSRNQNNMSEGSNMSTCGLLFQCVGLVQGAHLHHLFDSCDNLKHESTDYVQVIILKQFYLSQFILFYFYFTGSRNATLSIRSEETQKSFVSKKFTFYDCDSFSRYKSNEIM
jgi:hypothetical protein